MRLGPVLAAGTAGLALASASAAGWATAADGEGSGKASQLAGGAIPVATAPALSLTITVAWAATPLATGYVLTRYDSLGIAQAPGGTCAGTVSSLSCSETVAPGSYTYSIEPRRNSWAGPQGEPSAPLTVPHL